MAWLAMRWFGVESSAEENKGSADGTWSRVLAFAGYIGFGITEYMQVGDMNSTDFKMHIIEPLSKHFVYPSQGKWHKIFPPYC